MFLQTTSRASDMKKSSMPPARVGLIAIVGLIVVSWVIASVGMAL
ncbi:hypothetical protein [Pontimonas salivibrio]|nr:hypothetical protein [Pontimonas salivibrio]